VRPARHAVRVNPAPVASIARIDLDPRLCPADDLVRCLAAARAGPAECEPEGRASRRQGPGASFAHTFDEVDRFDLAGFGEQDPEACGADPRAVVAGTRHPSDGLSGFSKASTGDMSAPCAHDLAKTLDIEQDDREWPVVSSAPRDFRDEQAAPKIGPFEARFWVGPAHWQRTDDLGLPLCDVIRGHDESLDAILRVPGPPVATVIVVPRRITSHMTIVRGPRPYVPGH